MGESGAGIGLIEPVESSRQKMGESDAYWDGAATFVELLEWQLWDAEHELSERFKQDDGSEPKGIVRREWLRGWESARAEAVAAAWMASDAAGSRWYGEQERHRLERDGWEMADPHGIRLVRRYG